MASISLPRHVAPAQAFGSRWRCGGQLARFSAPVVHADLERLAHRPGESEGAEVDRVVTGFAPGDADEELLGAGGQRYDPVLDVAELLELRPGAPVPPLDGGPPPPEEHLRHARHRAALPRAVL